VTGNVDGTLARVARNDLPLAGWSSELGGATGCSFAGDETLHRPHAEPVCSCG
jgi:hypothetical protein